MSDLKYRFDEIITTINLLPNNEDITEDMEIDPLLPNLTRDLHEPELYSAIICQTLKGDAEFRHKMSATLANSAITNINNNDKPNEDDMYALALAANILWAAGQGQALFATMGVIGRIAEHYEVEIPDFATAFLRGNRRASLFSKLDPYKILSGDTTDMLETLLDLDSDETDHESIMDSLRNIIMRAKDGE